MRYEIRLRGRLGPLMSAALGEDVRVVPVPPRTLLTVRAAPREVPDLLRVLYRLGIEVSRLRVVVDGQEQAETSAGDRLPSDP